MFSFCRIKYYLVNKRSTFVSSSFFQRRRCRLFRAISLSLPDSPLNETRSGSECIQDSIWKSAFMQQALRLERKFGDYALDRTERVIRDRRTKWKTDEIEFRWPNGKKNETQKEMKVKVYWWKSVWESKKWFECKFQALKRARFPSGIRIESNELKTRIIALKFGWAKLALKYKWKYFPLTGAPKQPNFFRTH